MPQFPLIQKSEQKVNVLVGGAGQIAGATQDFHPYCAGLARVSPGVSKLTHGGYLSAG